MSIHYNAFISYRHHPDDIRVASEIHRSLERFHVPRSIRKKYGKIERLFRDKEELPITSDLNDDIDSALYNSDYLIVICSVHTKESIWVQREIELFLKTHPRNKVLTVLASGEPYDVIPDILLHEDVEDPVTGETRRIDIEPLSCDWRGNRRKARQEELPRLAAPLLGCAYDELRQRQKQYKARRNAAIVSSALVASFSLTAYFLYTSITIQRANVQIQAQNETIKAANVQIKANLDESLINQSRHLATAALERLTGGDRLTAISLAAAALPSENNPRPYVPEAERVLAEALGVYDVSGQMKAIGTVTPGINAKINRLCIPESEKVLYLLDDRDMITAWDTATLQQLGEIPLSFGAPDEMFALDDNNLIFWGCPTNSQIFCYQPDGTLVWQQDDCIDAAYLPSANAVLMLCGNAKSAYTLQVVDSATGDSIGNPWDLSLEDPEYYPAGFVATPNEEAGLALIAYYKSYNAPWLYYAVDLTTGEQMPVELPAYPAASLITDSGRFVFLTEADGMGMAGVIEGDRITTPGTRQIFCLDLRTGNVMWQSAITSSVSGIYGATAIPESENILCVSGNVFMIISSETGVTVTECSAGSGIISVEPGAQSATAVLQDGYLCNYHYSFNYCYESKCMKDGVSGAAIGENCYAYHWLGDHVTIYRKVAGEPAWKYDMGSTISIQRLKEWGPYLAGQTSSKLYLFDTESRTLLWTMDREKKEILGFSSDGTTLWCSDGRTAVTAMDVTTGTCETLEIPADQGEIKSSPAFFNDCLYYVLGDLEQPLVATWNLNTLQQNTCPLQIDTEESYTYWSWEILHAEGQYLWLWRTNGMLVEVDLQTGIAQYVFQETSHRPFIAISDDGAFMATCNEETIRIRKPGQDTVLDITLDGAKAGNLYFHKNNILALCDNRFVYRFDLSGNLLSQTELQIDSPSFSSNLISSGTTSAWISWQAIDGNKLIINAMGSGNVIECDTWALQASITNFLAYDANSNSLVCIPAGGIAGYSLYNTAELLAIAAEELGSFQLTPEQKISYGID